MDGIIVVNKPSSMTSHDVCFKLKKILHEKKIGHTGTLDPMTTGVLVVCVGQATKLVDILVFHDKTYLSTVKFGKSYDTYDVFGNLVEEKDVNINKDNIGKSIQTPPIYSSIKVNGKKLYEYARKNQSVEIPKREIEIYDIKRTSDFIDNEFSFMVKGSKGFYVRSLCVDIANKLNTIGAMKDLKRIQSGDYKIEDSYTLEDIENNNYKIIPIEKVLDKYEKLYIKDYLVKMVLNGVTLDQRQITTNNPFTVYSSSGKLLALYKGEDNKYKPVIIFGGE